MNHKTVVRYAVRSAVVTACFAALFTTAMSYVHEMTAQIIAKKEQQALQATISTLIPTQAYNNDILQDTQQQAGIEALGQRKPFLLYRAKMNGQVVGCVFTVITTRGYGGPITLLVGIKPNMTLWGIRVLEHHETPGLGDYVDHRHQDPHTHRAWTDQFRQLRPTLRARMWDIKKNGGYFDYVAGASITPRAIITAVHRTVDYVQTHRAIFFE